MKKLSLIGQTFGRLTVIGEGHKNKQGSYKWLCKCICGKELEVLGSKLKNGHTKSCGCIVKEGIHKTHDKTNTRIYRIYCAMKTRCYNKNVSSYKNYGGRGVKICDEWLNDFITFYNWSIENGYKDNLSIDRIDVNGNYEPNNCRWTDTYTQMNNTRKTKKYTYDGKSLTLKEWSRILNIPYTTLRSRVLEMKWDLDYAFFERKK